MQLNIENLRVITIDIRRERFFTESCGHYSFSPQLPVETIKKWTISRTKEALTILCNGVEVLNLVSAEYDKYCARGWSKSSTKIKFMNGDMASDYEKSLSVGRAMSEVTIFYISSTFIPRLIQFIKIRDFGYSAFCDLFKKAVAWKLYYIIMSFTRSVDRFCHGPKTFFLA